MRWDREPRVVRGGGQPWAMGRNALGVEGLKGSRVEELSRDHFVFSQRDNRATKYTPKSAPTTLKKP
jgi:hypothetical protein